jgi:hypothetical protein
MQIYDDIHARITCPPANVLEIVHPPFGEVLRVRVDKILLEPVPYRDADCVEPVLYHLADIVLRDPGLPVVRKRLVSSLLSESHHAVELGLLPTTAHVAPCRVGHPRLDDKVAAKVDAADLVRSREPAFAGGRCHIEDVCACGGEDVSVDAREPGKGYRERGDEGEDGLHIANNKALMEDPEADFLLGLAARSDPSVRFVG